MPSDERDALDVGATQGDHRAEVALVHRLDRVQAEPRGEPAVERRRRAAALDVAEHDGAGLLARTLLDLRREPVADATEAYVTEGVLLAADRATWIRRRPARHLRRPR